MFLPAFRGVFAPFRMKKAFLISYRFPPQAGGGVQRTLKYTKYLRQFGWEPVVHTARNPFWDVWDESLLEEIPDGVAIHETGTFEVEKLESQVRSLASRILGRFRKRAPAGVGEVASSKSKKLNSKSARRGLGGRLRDWIYKVLLIPDQQIFWVVPALIHGRRILRREAVSVIHTSSPPNSLHLYGGLLARWTGLPWVADFRDPWTDGPRRRRNYVGNPLRERIELSLERWVVANADHVVVSAPPLRERFLAKYEFLRAENISVITNGYDVDDFSEATKIDERLLPEEGFHLVSTGNIEHMFPARHLFEALASACKKRPDLRRDLRLHLVGAKQGPYDDLLQTLGLADQVSYEGWVPHARSIRYLQESDAMLMCMIPQKGGGNEKLSGKGFEYLYIRKPFLCLATAGLSADLFSQTSMAKVVDPYEEAKIEEALIALYEGRNESIEPNEELVQRFDRRNLTASLAALFDRLQVARGVSDLRPGDEVVA